MSPTNPATSQPGIRLVLPNPDDPSDPANLQAIVNWAQNHTVNQIRAGSGVTLDTQTQALGTGAQGTNVVTVNAAGSTSAMYFTGIFLAFDDPPGTDRYVFFQEDVPWVDNTASLAITTPIMFVPASKSMVNNTSLEFYNATTSNLNITFTGNLVVSNTTGTQAIHATYSSGPSVVAPGINAFGQPAFSIVNQVGSNITITIAGFTEQIKSSSADLFTIYYQFTAG